MTSFESSRDIDLQTAVRASAALSSETGNHFILTGSYSIEALTGRSVTHNDIDANVFTMNPRSAVRGALGRIGLTFYDNPPNLVLHTDTRLDYQWPEETTSQKLELQFVKVIDAREKGNETTFVLGNKGDQEILVPTTIRSLRDTHNQKHDFRVKTLPYAIATWALRISGVAQNQKRAVRGTDIAHFAFLLSADYDEGDVLRAIEHHPQTPDGCSADEVLTRALAER